MLSKMLGQIRKWDEATRGYFGNRGAQGRLGEIRAMEADLRSRLGAAQPDYDSVGATIANALHGQAGFGRNEVIDRLKRNEDPDDLIYRASVAQRPGMGTRLNYMMAGTDAMSRAGQAGVYGAIGGGVTLGLTAAGQGILALMDYMQEGQRTEAQREQQLV